jgi:hypothetical protein
MDGSHAGVSATSKRQSFDWGEGEARQTHVERSSREDAVCQLRWIHVPFLDW